MIGRMTLLLLLLPSLVWAGIEGTIWKYELLFHPDISINYGFKNGEIYFIDTNGYHPASEFPNTLRWYIPCYAFMGQFFWEHGAVMHSFFGKDKGVAIQLSYLYFIPIIPLIFDLSLEGRF